MARGDAGAGVGRLGRGEVLVQACSRLAPVPVVACSGLRWPVVVREWVHYCAWAAGEWGSVSAR